MVLIFLFTVHSHSFTISCKPLLILKLSVPGKMDPFIGVWGYFLAASRFFGWGFIQANIMQQALFQQEDTQRLLEANQAGGADNCWINLLQVLILEAHVLAKHQSKIMV